jgi:hypothetical protein
MLGNKQKLLLCTGYAAGCNTLDWLANMITNLQVHKGRGIYDQLCNSQVLMENSAVWSYVRINSLIITGRRNLSVIRRSSSKAL